jgi:hypothetical protein
VSCATSPAASYMVYRNGMIITSGTWTADQDIAIPVDNLATGTYSFMIVATDGFGGQVTDVMDLTVISPTAPLFSIPEILMSALLGLIFIAVFLRGRTGSPDSRARDVSPALVDSKGSGKQDVKDSKPTAPAKKTK